MGNRKNAEPHWFLKDKRKRNNRIRMVNLIEYPTEKKNENKY